MANVLWIEDEEGFDQSHPGCMSGIFHALDYHYWHSNVRKILPHRKHEDFIKHMKRDRRYQKTSYDQDPLEVIKLLDAKASHIQMDQRNRKTNKRSLKARIKALVSEHNDQDSVPSPKLYRTYSIHHLENHEWVHPIIFFPENVTESPKTHSNVTHPEVNDSLDVLDMFEDDKELFINMPVVRQTLTKSGSFPTAYKSGSRSLMPMKLKDKLNETYIRSKSEKIKNSNADLNIDTSDRLRRISSLNESADRYSQLFDFSVGKEATLRSSRSLKLTNVLSAQQPSSFRRNNPNQGSSQNERNPVSSTEEEHKHALLNSAQDCESLNEVTDKSDILENEDYWCKDSHGFKTKEDLKITQQSPVLVPEYHPPDEKVQIFEDLDLSRNSFKNLKKEMKTVNSKKHIDLSMKNDDFTYVKKILESSGFLKNEFQQTWYSSNQPLGPFMFQELESQYLHDPERFTEEVYELSHRLLIFDLVDEVLVTMYEKSLAYYPKKLSLFGRIRSAPTGSLVLDEVWTRMSQLINSKHDMNESLNDIVSRDLGSDDSWMNLQSDSEFVGLELEDLILDEVLEELLVELF